MHPDDDEPENSAIPDAESVSQGSSEQNSSQQVERLFREHGRELRAMFYAWCGDRERAADAVQQVFLKFQQQPAGTIQEPRAWLLQVGKNWLRDVARQRESAWRAPQRERWDDLADHEVSPAEAASRADVLAQIRRVMQTLRPDDREVLVMRYSLGWSSQRMADALASSAAAIDMRLSRARQRLAVQLTAAGIDADSLG